jgi:hypothetical protein
MDDAVQGKARLDGFKARIEGALRWRRDKIKSMA